jgi:hypothetical protein
MAKKKITLENLATQLGKMDARMTKGFASVEAKIENIDARMERGFAAVAEDVVDIRRNMASKDQIIALHTQVSSMEIELRGMKHVKLQARVADLEEEVFGETRA